MNRKMTARHTVVLLILAIAVSSIGLVAGADHRDPKAVAVVDALQAAIAPNDGWNKVGVLQFTFSVVKEGKTQGEIHHLWEVKTGQYRVQWKGADGNEKLILFNVTTKEGQAWMRPAGTEAPGASWTAVSADQLNKMLETGYGRFINDTYWLLMPLKMNDAGVNLDYDGEKTIEGRKYDVVRMTFNNVGLTPGDTYWVYVNRETHLIDRWEFILEGERAKAAEKEKDAAKGKAAENDKTGTAAKAPEPERTAWVWTDWKSFGPIRLATTKTMTDGKVAIVLKDVEVMNEAPAGSFAPPGK